MIRIDQTFKSVFKRVSKVMLEKGENLVAFLFLAWTILAFFQKSLLLRYLSGFEGPENLTFETRILSWPF